MCCARSHHAITRIRRRGIEECHCLCQQGTLRTAALQPLDRGRCERLLRPPPAAATNSAPCKAALQPTCLLLTLSRFRSYHPHSPLNDDGNKSWSPVRCDRIIQSHVESSQTDSAGNSSGSVGRSQAFLPYPEWSQGQDPCPGEAAWDPFSERPVEAGRWATAISAISAVSAVSAGAAAAA